MSQCQYYVFNTSNLIAIEYILYGAGTYPRGHLSGGWDFSGGGALVRGGVCLDTWYRDADCITVEYYHIIVVIIDILLVTIVTLTANAMNTHIVQV